MNVEIGTEAALFPKKEYRSGIFLAVQPGCHLTNSHRAEIRESLVSDIPAGDGKMANLFYSVMNNLL